MRPLINHWPYALFFWAVFLWAYVPEWRIVGRRSEPSGTSQDARSKQFISVGQALGSAIAFMAAFGVPSAALPFHVGFFWAGLVVMSAGSLLRRHCWRMLGTSFTGAVIVRAEQRIVRRGAYRFVRHPSYTGGLLMFLGLGLALGNWISVLVITVLAAATYWYRIVVEERALLATLGEPYRDYMAHTKRLIPGVL